MSVFTAAEKAEAAEREVKYRKRVYERRVEAGQMTRHLANLQINVMQEIAADYRAQAEKERLI